MGLALSPDILQFGAVLVKDFAFALGVFAVLVVGSPKLVAPANEGGPCGQSTNVFAWALSVYRLDLDAVRATGGIDAELYARRVRMRLARGAGPPQRPPRGRFTPTQRRRDGAAASAASPSPTSGTTARGPRGSGRRSPRSGRRARDIRAMGAIYRDRQGAGAHHYAAVITASEDLRDERRLRTFFERRSQRAFDAAAASPLVVVPSPEPREFDWPALEAYEADEGDRADKETVGRGIKGVLNVCYSVLVTGLVIGIQELLRATSRVFPWLETNRRFNSLWSESALQRSVQEDFALFLCGVGFAVPLLGASLYEAVSEMGSDPLSIFNLMASNVPSLGYTFAMLVLMQIGGSLQEALRLESYGWYRVNRDVRRVDADDLDASLEPEDADYGALAGWEAFALLVGAAYAPLAPFTTFVCGCYLFVLYGLAKHDVANVSTTPFNTEGALWYAGVRQTIAALGFALALNGGVIALNGGLWQALCCLPLGLVWHKYYAAAERRYATRSLHGLSKGRLPLRDASDVDAARDPAATEALLARLCDEDMYFSAPDAATFHYLCAQRCSATEGGGASAHERALRDARAAAARAPPGASGAHNLLGAVCDRLGLGGEALEAYKRAAKEDPKDCHAHFNVGAAHQKRGELVLAEHAYIRATQAWTKYALAYYNLANVLQKKGESLRAVEAYKDCVAADPTFEKAHAALAFFHEKNGDKVRAHRHKVAAQTKGEAARRAQQPVSEARHCADYSLRQVVYARRRVRAQGAREVRTRPWCKNDPGNKDGRRYSKRGF
ncbi:hypothetical protein JL721_12486 [Aureococcus anophagefferens]|nr:hypothetical protein JL721_12486 [Aureococcus anophagefferens]